MAEEPLICGVSYSEGGQFLYEMAVVKTVEGFTVGQEYGGCNIAFFQLFY